LIVCSSRSVQSTSSRSHLTIPTGEQRLQIYRITHES
jgi:hypothetical protein